MFTTQLAKVQYDAVFVNSEQCTAIWNSDRNKISGKIVYLVFTDECESGISQAKVERDMEFSNLCSKFTTFLTLNSLPLKHCSEIAEFTLFIFSSSLNMWIVWSTLLIPFKYLFVTCCMMDQGNPKYLVYTFCDEILSLHTFGINWTRCRASRIDSIKGDI